MYNILICDDEADIVSALKIYLASPDMKFFEAKTGREAIEIVENEDIHLILLDIMMPVMDGITAAARIRERSNVPIIFLSAKSEDSDKILGLNIGADDYITKPFSIREVLARVKANMRRFAGDTKEEAQDIVVVAKDFIINTTKYEAVKNGVTLDLTLREYELLKFLVTQPNRIFSREALLSSVWGYEFYGDVRTVDVTVRRLREKVEDDSSNPRFILTKRSVGYYFNKEAE